MKRVHLLFLTLQLMLLCIPALPAYAQPVNIAPPAWDGTLRRMRVPILMYHYVGTLPQDADIYRTDLTVDPGAFREQLNWLRAAGYTTISLYELYNALMTGAALPHRPVVLTFDDGYSDHYTTVYPLLQEFGFTGTFFIITGRADSNAPNHLTWNQIAEMAAAGMSMQPHTKSHVDLRNRDYDFLVYEIVGSLESLEAHTGIPARMFAYPAGRYDTNTLSTIAALPVWGAVTTRSGALHTTDSVLTLPRLRVHRTTSLNGFIYLLENS